MTFSDGERGYTILICAEDVGTNVARIVYDELRNHNLNVGLEYLHRSSTVCSVRRCTVFVPILTPQMEQLPITRAVFDEARRLRKPIVPVIAIRKWKSADWVGLAIAGIAFFRIFDQETANKEIGDSNPITNLRVAVEVSIRW